MVVPTRDQRPGFIILKMSAIVLELFGFRVISFVSYRNMDVRLKRYGTESREVRLDLNLNEDHGVANGSG